MNVIRIREPDALRPLHVVMLCLVTITVGGGSLLLSAAESKTLIDGAVEWRTESPLRAAVELLCLLYQFPTVHAGAVKIYILGMGSFLAILTLSVAVGFGGRAGEEESTADDVAAAPGESTQPDQTSPRRHIAPLVAAQVLVGLYLLWSFASGRWSAAPKLAVGGSILLTIHFLWAFGIGQGLSPAAARIASRIIIGVAAVTSLVAIWYYYGRNPTLRAKFPFGNPTFLSACLIPGLLLTASWACEHVGQLIRRRRMRSIAPVGLAALILLVTLWAFYLAGSRGPLVGLMFGLLAMAFFALPGRLKLVPLLVGVGVALYGASYVSTASQTASPTGRDATLRFRGYTWDYAWRMFNEKPFTGHGQGGFVLTADSYVGTDVLNDPAVFGGRISHAHSEWLEVMADLGAVGIVLLGAALLLTLWSGMVALEAGPAPGVRWTLVGLLSALMGLCIEESFGVGLRVSGVPTLFYTVIGLIWALAGDGGTSLLPRLSATTGRRLAAGVGGGLLALAVFGITQQDFSAARDGYRVQTCLQEGDDQQAIELAARAVSRLNPQRALVNLLRLGEAHLLAARRLGERADHRDALARAGEPPSPSLFALARWDRDQSETHCREGNRALKELVTYSPGFLNHGWVSYWLNLTKAGNANARGEFGQRDQFTQDAAAALLRELSRQPFDPVISLEYVGVAGRSLSTQDALEFLARPLRHNPTTPRFVNLLDRLASGPEFGSLLESIVKKAREPDETPAAWTPEKLRLAARLHIIRGDYLRAREILELAATAYESVTPSAPIGEASCYLELSACRFLSDPHDPANAIGDAQRALDLAPQSMLGRALKLSAEQRMVDYYLAAGNEEEAKRLLGKMGPPQFSEEDLRAALGARYRGVCRSLLLRREALVIRKAPGDLLPKLNRWMQRAIELNPLDPASHFLAADLAFHSDDCAAAAAHLRRAIETGLKPDVARQFLDVALNKGPGCKALEELAKELPPPKPSDQPIGVGKTG